MTKSFVEAISCDMSFIDKAKCGKLPKCIFIHELFFLIGTGGTEKDHDYRIWGKLIEAAQTGLLDAKLIVPQMLIPNNQNDWKIKMTVPTYSVCSDKVKIYFKNKFDYSENHMLLAWIDGVGGKEIKERKNTHLKIDAKDIIIRLFKSDISITITSKSGHGMADMDELKKYVGIYSRKWIENLAREVKNEMGIETSRGRPKKTV